MLLAGSKESDISSTQDLISSMHDRYKRKFNKSISFIQINTHFQEDGTKKISTSLEAYHFPGQARVDESVKHGEDGVIYKNDTAYVFEHGELVKKEFWIHNILLLTGDIYFLGVDKTLDKLKKLEYDLTVFRKDKWEGRDVYVVGGKEGDLTSPQFWIDAENLYVVRNIHYSHKTGELEDQHFFEHEIVGHSWVEDEVHIYVKNKLVRKERYAEVKADNAKVVPKVFVPEEWGNYHWHD